MSALKRGRGVLVCFPDEVLASVLPLATGRGAHCVRPCAVACNIFVFFAAHSVSLWRPECVPVPISVRTFRRLVSAVGAGKTGAIFGIRGICQTQEGSSTGIGMRAPDASDVE